MIAPDVGFGVAGFKTLEELTAGFDVDEGCCDCEVRFNDEGVGGLLGWRWESIFGVVGRLAGRCEAMDEAGLLVDKEADWLVKGRLGRLEDIGLTEWLEDIGLTDRLDDWCFTGRLDETGLTTELGVEVRGRFFRVPVDTFFFITLPICLPLDFISLALKKKEWVLTI